MDFGKILNSISDDQVYKYASMHINASMQVFEFASMQVCEYACMQVCTCFGLQPDGDTLVKK